MKPTYVIFAVAACTLMIASSVPVTASGTVAGAGELAQNADCLHEVVLEGTGAAGTWSFSVESKREYDGTISTTIISFPNCFLNAPQVHVSLYVDEWDPATGGCLDSPADPDAELCLTNPRAGSTAVQTRYTVSLKNHVPGATLTGSMDLTVVSA